MIPGGHGRGHVPRAHGTYVLLLECTCPGLIRVGALGTLELRAGFYGYVGSAHGPGGLAARIAHHRHHARRPYWHVDHLRRHTCLREIWLAVDPGVWEHAWAQALGDARTATRPLARFGASDCRCESHLAFFARRPRLGAFRGRLAARRLPAGAGALPAIERVILG